MSDSLAFLADGGEAARLIRERDWSDHPLGPPETWPAELRAALSLVLNSPESMLLAWGPDLHFFFNDTYAPLLGPRLSWAMGERFDVVWADGWDQAKPIIEDAFAGRSRRFENLPWKLGTDRGPAETWFTFSYSRVLDGEGRVAGLFVITNETTAAVLGEAARREAENRLRLEAERQRLSLQQMPGFACILTGPEHRYLYVNDAYVSVAGARPFVGRSVREVFPELEGQGFFELLDRVYATGEPFLARAMPIRLAGEGEERHLDFIYQPVRDDAGALTGIFVGGYDVTEWKRVERALAELNASLQGQVAARTAERDQAWQASSDLLSVADLDGRFLSLNPAWTATLGWSEAELKAKPLLDLVHPDDRERTKNSMAALARGEPQLGFENRYRTRDGGYRWFSWNSVPRNGLVYASVRDVTVIKEQAEALARTEEALRQAQKMEAVGQLTGGLAHDFNNLLAGISGSLELMQTRLAQGRLTDLDRYMTAAQGASKRAAALTHRLLAFSRRQTLDPKPTNVNALVHGMEELIRRTVGPAIEVETVGASGLWTALVDPH